MIGQGILIGGSAGGAEALRVILSALPADFPLPILVVQHLHASDDGSFSRHLARDTRLTVVEPCDKQPIQAGTVYTAPANYHMLVEKEGTVSLSVDPRVRWSRPSINVLFESAARAWGAGVTAVILSGANDDGTAGMMTVKAHGGRTLAQSPEEATSRTMPQTAIAGPGVDHVLPAAGIAAQLLNIAGRQLPPAAPPAPQRVAEVQKKRRKI